MSYLKQLIKAYEKLGIPIILNLKVPSEGNEIELEAHAVTICGYKLKQGRKKKSPKGEIILFSDSMEKIYVHDDQWGPFSRIIFKQDYLESSWTDSDIHGNRPTHSSELLIPVYSSIRISYDDVYSILIGIDAVLRLAFEDNLVEDLVWDLHITFSNDFKEVIRKSSLTDKEKEIILQKCYPKYIWSASCHIGDNKIFEYIFDATALSSSMYGIEAIGYNSTTKKFISEFLEINQRLCNNFEHQNCVDFIDFMRFTL